VEEHQDEFGGVAACARQFEATKREAAGLVAGMSDAQLNWRPAPDSWSVGQCLMHLATGSDAVLPAIDRAIEKGRAKGWPVPVSPADGAAADVGMAANVARDYGRAARLLGKAVATDSSAGVRFFLGVSLLWSGRTREAVGPLSLAAGDSLSPYAPEAGLLLAKALLRSGAADSARRSCAASPGAPR